MTIAIEPTQERSELLKDAYLNIIRVPLLEKYEDTWEEETYWAAVEAFKLKSREIGYDDPFEVMSEFKLTSFEQIRDRLKAGPPACFRKGWTSPLLGSQIDPQAAITPLLHAGPELSDLAEKHAGKVAIVGINNDSIFVDKGDTLGHVKQFLEDNKSDFRYTVYVDTKRHATESVYSKTGYAAIPCVIVLLDGVVTFVGPPEEEFVTALDGALKAIEA
ncbi:hypothetical protein BGW38_003704 [Lunasporangiospora selenospora]|uniref:Uncharacterized protein n=1 Tax=Lunasporangiospora selenospora TaxID=979761 RepID=A0A9P6KC08_9FUNG|nr:hypothetical protein BGW38_003704 [Lunasporangiospora selenospora]